MANKNTNKKQAVKQTAKQTALPVQPEINDMSDEEFENYINAQKNEDMLTKGDRSLNEASREVGADSNSDVPGKDHENGNASGQEGAYSEASRHSYEDGRRQILERWFRDTERLKKEVPDFDLDEAMKNEEFRNFVISGMSVDGAYYAVKYKEMTKNPRRSIMQNASSRALKSGSSMNDILSMNDGDFRKRLRSIMNGD